MQCKLVEKSSGEIKALARILSNLFRMHILFGHQYATKYGRGLSGDADRSDVKSVTGSHPAVTGVDFSGLIVGLSRILKK